MVHVMSHCLCVCASICQHLVVFLSVCLFICQRLVGKIKKSTNKTRVIKPGTHAAFDERIPFLKVKGRGHGFRGNHGRKNYF